MNKITIVFLTILLIVFILSCSKKNNFIGFEEDIEDKIVTDTLFNSIDFEKSYLDSLSNYSGNTKLIIGKYNGVEVRSLLKFKNLPNSAWVDSTTINSCEIIIKKKLLFDANFDVNVYKVTLYWNENSVNFDSLWNAYSNQLAQFNTSQDTIVFNIEIDTLKSWIESDSTNFGIMFKYENENLENNFIEFYSSESSNYPYLQISYTDTSNTDTTKIYIASEDIFIGNITNGEILDSIVIRNLPPTEIIFSFCLDSLINILENLSDLSKISVNKAEVIIDSTMIFSYFISDSYLELKPYYISDTINIDYENISGISTSRFYPDNDILEMNITSIIQGYIIGELVNNKILIKSITENKDFSYIKFCDNIKPTLKITYTKPIFSE